LNASLAVRLPGDTGAVLVSVCSSEVSTKTARSILCSHYNSVSKATDLIVLGDFDRLADKKEDCGHGVFHGEELTDCLPETFDSYDQYEDTILRFPYDHNYVFKEKTWWEVVTDGNTVKYIKLKKQRKRKNVKTK